MKTFLQGPNGQVRVIKLLSVLVAMIVLALSLGVISAKTNILYAAKNTDAGYGGSGYQGGGNDVTVPGDESGGAAEGTSGQGGGDQEGSKPDDVGSGGSGSAGGGKPAGVGGGEEGEEPVAGNNLSFPVITADGFALAAISSSTFSEIYDGPYTNLSDEEKALLVGQDWYAQKTEGNLWQAEFVQNPIGSDVAVYGVDWGDNIEAVNPVIGRPFRVEITLYHHPVETMNGYTMQLLAFPSSPNEVQGTNGDTYESAFATIVSPKPLMNIQYLGTVATTSLSWSDGKWVSGDVALPATALAFASELNVGGKYIYGASKGGWKPVESGIYRLTFYAPESDISFAEAVVGNYGDWTVIVEDGEEVEEDETGAAQPVVDSENNLTYVDVTVVSKRDGGKPANPGEGEDEAAATLAVSDAVLAATLAETGEMCEPYLTDYLGVALDNDPIQVVLLQKFLNDTLDTNLILNGVYDTPTFVAVSLFQVTYAEEVLQPWVAAGHTDVVLTEGTGYVGATTLELINEIMCE